MATEESTKLGIKWMMNNDITGAKWMMLPTKLVLPYELPKSLLSYGSVWLVVGEPLQPLKSAVKEGVNLTMKYLGMIREQMVFPLPEKGKGSGKGGNIIKIDWATSLVNHLWPNETEEEKTRMINAICGNSVSKVKCPSKIIAAVKELGQEGERDFNYLHQVALNQEMVEKERNRRDPTADREDQKTYTPTTLKSLLPKDVPGVLCSRNPLLSRYQGFYPGIMDSKLSYFQKTK